jgi:hypothetical protein
MLSTVSVIDIRMLIHGPRDRCIELETSEYSILGAYIPKCNTSPMMR